MKLLVIIVTYNAMQWAERCFGSLRKSTAIPDVFVVDNGSTDGTQTYILNNYPDVIFQQSGNNLGFGMANNIGLQYALDKGYDYVYLLNQDAWVLPDTFERLIDICKKYPEYGILSPFQMNADLYHIDQSFYSNVLAWESNCNIVNDFCNNDLKDVYSVPWVMAAHWFITKECISKVGGFSPTFHHYAEDVNYCDRLHFWGMKVGVIPSLRVVHDRAWREDSSGKILYMGYTNILRDFSNPERKSKFIIADVFKTCLKYFILSKSMRSLRYIVGFLFAFRLLLNNRNISMSEECAFLNSNKFCRSRNFGV